MRSIVLASSLALLFSSSVASAQIVVENPTKGGVATNTSIVFVYDTYISTLTTTTLHWRETQSCIVGSSSFGNGWKHSMGIVEFDLEGLPTEAMTSNNFTARLNSLSAIAGVGDSPFLVQLFDLDDEQEDNVITFYDFDQILGIPIAGALYDPPTTMPHFDDVDVTEELKRDLFGAGTLGSTSGFLMRESDAWNGSVNYENSTPSLTITLVPTSVDAGPDSSTDGDADTDTDTEDKPGGAIGGGCGCNSPGNRPAGDSLLGNVLSILFS